MASNIGLNVVEVDGAGVPPPVGAAVSVAAFSILTQRGVPNRPTRITSLARFQEQFGTFFSGGLGAYLVKGFFDNGGQTAYINRIVATDPTTGATPSTSTLRDNADEATLLLQTGFRGTIDPGAWGRDVYVKVDPSSPAPVHLLETAPATVSGTPLAEPIDMSATRTLSVIVDGESTPTSLTFLASDFPTPAQATRVQIRDAINGKTTKLIASISADNRLVLTSTGAVAKIRKDWTSLQVTADIAALGLAAMGTPNRGVAAALTDTGTRLAGVEGIQVGDAVRISDATHSSMAKITSIVPSAGQVAWSPAVATIGSFDAYATTLTKVEFDLAIAYRGTQAENVVETWSGLSMEPDVPNCATKVLNDSLQGSRYVMAIDRHSASGVGVNVPRALAFSALTPGSDGTATVNDFVGDQALHTGFYAFDAYDVQLLACERSDPAIVTAALAYCASRGDCMFVGSVPKGSVGNSQQAVSYGQAFQGKKVYGALYGPWVKILDPAGIGPNPTKWVPPTGHVMGVYTRIESSRGIWKAPAGDEANLLGVLDVETRLSDTDHTDLVKNGSVNGIRAVPRAGIVVDASRTLSTDPRWWYVNVRLLFNYVKSSLRQGLSWVRQEPNRDTLWNAVKFSSVVPFLMGLWRQGAFGTGTPEQVFTVICDASNNPPDQVDQGNFKMEVYFYPSKPAETIIIIVGQQPSGATAAEA